MTCPDPSCLYLKLLATTRVAGTLKFLTSHFHSPPVFLAPPPLFLSCHRYGLASASVLPSHSPVKCLL